jgi:hypothetical protein
MTKMDIKHISHVLDALAKTKELVTQTNLKQGTFQCMVCKQGVVSWSCIKTGHGLVTRGICSTRGCIQWIE